MIKTSETFRSAIVGSPRRIEILAVVDISDPDTVFGAVSGVLVGKPMDRKYEAEYKAALTDVIADDTLPIVCNVNIGHALPRCILPFGVEAAVNVNGQKITFG